MSVLLVFVDGLGIGSRGSHNPLSVLGAEAYPLAIFDREEPALPYDGRLARTDACLGVEGRPQSASGQTTILTGVNASLAVGFHKQGFPNEHLREIIREHSIFLQLKQADIEPNVFVNAYTSAYFQKRPRWVSATTVAVEAAGMRFRDLDDLRANEALFHDFTNRMLIERGIANARERTPEEAAAILAQFSIKQRFTLYEYFITDRVGHLQDMKAARTVLAELARFVRALLACVELQRTTVVLTSDHGNIEDLRIRNHTLNAVPTLAWGACRDFVQGHVRTLADITPTIVEILSNKSKASGNDTGRECVQLAERV